MMSRVSAYPSRPPSRPASEQLCDLHVYKVPWELWRAPLNNILNQSVTDTISLGIIRVHPDTPLIDVRGEIARQLEELAPRDYVFLRSVGRSITRLKNKQEYQLKAKHFLPPVHYAPELFLLEGTADNIAAISDRSSQQSPTSLHRGSPGARSYRDGYNNNRSYRNGYADHSVPARRGSPGPSPSRKAAAGQAYKGANGYRGYHDDDDDSGDVAGTSPEDQYSKDRNRDRDKENFYDALKSKTQDLHNRLDRDRVNADDDDDDDARRRLQDMEEGAEMDKERWASEQEERRRRAEAERRRAEEERKKAEEEEKKRRQQQQHEEEEKKRRQQQQQQREEEEKRRRQQQREEEEKKRRRLEEEEEEEERRRREETARLKGSDEGLNRFPSPPPLHLSSPDVNRDSDSARQRRKEEKKRLLEELEHARSARQNTEREREELVKKAKNLQNKTQNRRNQARDIWKKRYFDEKKKTPPLEEQTNRLQEELEALHRKLMSALEGPKEKNLKLGDNRPSQKNNYVIQCTKLQHDIDDLKRRVENAKMKLTAEMKLRNQAEVELRALRAELVQKKISLSLSRSQQFAALNPSMPMPAIEPGKGAGEMQIAAV